MKKLLIIFMSIGLFGCATPQQNAALTGAIIGATVATSIYIPPPPPSRTVCYSTIYRDYYGNLVRKTTCSN